MEQVNQHKQKDAHMIDFTTKAFVNEATDFLADWKTLIDKIPDEKLKDQDLSSALTIVSQSIAQMLQHKALEYTLKVNKEHIQTLKNKKVKVKGVK